MLGIDLRTLVLLSFAGVQWDQVALTVVRAGHGGTARRPGDAGAGRTVGADEMGPGGTAGANSRWERWNSDIQR